MQQWAECKHPSVFAIKFSSVQHQPHGLQHPSTALQYIHRTCGTAAVQVTGFTAGHLPLYWSARDFTAWFLKFHDNSQSPVLRVLAPHKLILSVSDPAITAQILCECIASHLVVCWLCCCSLYHPVHGVTSVYHLEHILLLVPALHINNVCCPSYTSCTVFPCIHAASVSSLFGAFHCSNPFALYPVHFVLLGAPFITHRECR